MTSTKGKVLVVDDDPIVLAVAQGRLEAAGFDVTTRDQVLGTSQWIVEHKPEFVLLDIVMPAMSGAELASFLKRKGIDTHVILHSSRDAKELRALARETGAIGSIPKGLDDDAFARQFGNLVRSARREG